MRVEVIKLDDWNPAPFNPRERLEPGSEEYERLSKSLDEFGLVDPLIVNERTKNIVGGHQRYWILLDKGRTEAHASIIDEDEEREKALNIVLNSPKLQGRWNPEALHRLVSGITDPTLDYLIADVDRDVERQMHSINIDDATSFLGLDPSDVEALAERVAQTGAGATGLKEDHPHRTGEQYFEVGLVLTADQRQTYFDAVALAKRNLAVENTMVAITEVCRAYVENHS